MSEILLWNTAQIDIFFAIFIPLLGLALGSFATLLIYRLHTDTTGTLWGRSCCRNCHRQIPAYHLIPIFSWIFLRGKCANCDKKISCVYPLTELTVGLSICLFFFFPPSFVENHIIMIWTLGIVFFTWVFFWYDTEFMEVDDRLVFFAVLLALSSYFFRENFTFYILGGFFGWAVYAFQYYISGRKWVGAGDMRLGLFMGLVLGYKILFVALFFSYLVGSIIALLCLISSRLFQNSPTFTWKSKLAMGAFLMPSLIIFLYDGPRLFEWYWNWVF